MLAPELRAGQSAIADCISGILAQATAPVSDNLLRVAAACWLVMLCRP